MLFLGITHNWLDGLKCGQTLSGSVQDDTVYGRKLPNLAVQPCFSEVRLRMKRNDADGHGSFWKVIEVNLWGSFFADPRLEETWKVKFHEISIHDHPWFHGSVSLFSTKGLSGCHIFYWPIARLYVHSSAVVWLGAVHQPKNFGQWPASIWKWDMGSFILKVASLLRNVQLEVALGSRDALQTCRALTWDTLAQGVRSGVNLWRSKATVPFIFSGWVKAFRFFFVCFCSAISNKYSYHSNIKIDTQFRASSKYHWEYPCKTHTKIAGWRRRVSTKFGQNYLERPALSAHILSTTKPINIRPWTSVESQQKKCEVPFRSIPHKS